MQVLATEIQDSLGRERTIPDFSGNKFCCYVNAPLAVIGHKSSTTFRRTQTVPVVEAYCGLKCLIPLGELKSQPGLYRQKYGWIRLYLSTLSRCQDLSTSKSAAGILRCFFALSGAR